MQPGCNLGITVSSIVFALRSSFQSMVSLVDTGWNNAKSAEKLAIFDCQKDGSYKNNKVQMFE